MSTSSFATGTFEPYVSPEVAAKYLGISRREVLAHTRSGRFVGHAVYPNARTLGHRRNGCCTRTFS